MTSPAKTASWGLDPSPSGRLSKPPPANQNSIRVYEPCAYETASGRPEWLSRDPIGEKGGVNLYGYVRNDPANLVDPDGKNPVIIGGAIIVVGAAIIAYNAYKIIHATEEFAKPYKEHKDECERILTDPDNAERHVRGAQAAAADAQKKAEELAAEAASQAISNPLGGAPGLPP